MDTFAEEHHDPERPLPRVPKTRLDSAPRTFLSEEDNNTILTLTLEEAGVDLGTHDRRIVAWLAGWEGSTVLTVASWIRRAATGADEEA